MHGAAHRVKVGGLLPPSCPRLQVGLKKDYNNANSGAARPPSERLLSGESWYSQQAFRALNQVGRHRPRDLRV